jgi:hypothetical protein
LPEDDKLRSNTVPEWRVRLTGQERDLRFLATALRDPWSVIEEDGRSYLRSSLFDGFGEAAEVKQAADDMIERANLAGLLHFERCSGVSTGEVVRVRPDGSQDISVSIATGLVIAEASVVAFSSSDGPASKPSPPDLTADIAFLEHQPAVVKALSHVSNEPHWYGYWKAVEAVGRAVGGVKGIVNLGWASDEQVERLRETAHHFRHHDHPTPPNPMTEAEARSFVVALLRRWIQWERLGRQKRSVSAASRPAARPR